MKLRCLKVCILALIVVAAVAWWLAPRVLSQGNTGKSAQEWLRFTEHAAQTVSYRAEGVSIAHGTSGRFVLNQGAGGAYTMQVTDAQGRACTLGFDGEKAWYETEHKAAATAIHESSLPSTLANARVLGRTTQAGQSAVRVRVRDGETEKELTLDARTGVILAMITRFQGNEVSRMQVERITYQPVTIRHCPLKDTEALRQAKAGDVHRLIGQAELRPTWVPRGFVAKSAVIHHCDCCGHEMVGLRYSDGLRSFTLMETADHNSCIEHGCYLSTGDSAQTATRIVGRVAVIAVGDLDTATLEKILDTVK